MGMLDGYKKRIVTIEKEIKVKSNFDYSEFTEDEKEELIELEERATHYGGEIRESIKELGKVFEEAQEKFSNHNGGRFVVWFENLGFKRDFVYLCLGRKNLSEKYGSELPYKLPDREVKLLSKLDKKDEEDKIFKVLESENPREELKVIVQEEKENKKYKETIDPLQKSLYDLKEEDEEQNTYSAELVETNSSISLKVEENDNYEEKPKKILKYLRRMTDIETKLWGREILSPAEEEKINNLLDEIEKIAEKQV